MDIQENQIIGEIVANDYRTASVFSKYAIDFCCQGNRTIEQACIEDNIDVDNVLSDLQAIDENHSELSDNYQTWSMEKLANHIVEKHHKYVQEKSMEITPYLEKICKVHGKTHPELFEIKDLFNTTAGEMAIHMKKEELILFPFIRKLHRANVENTKVSPTHFGSVENPINMMMDDHSEEGERFRKIDKLSNHYTPPQDACNTYRVTFGLLKEFEQDLHLHIHLENNILFPQAIEIEKKLN